MLKSAGQCHGDMPRYFAWKVKASLRRSSSKVIAEHVMHAAGGEHVGQRLEQVWAEVGGERLIGTLEARIDLAELHRVVAHVAPEPAAAAGEDALDLGGHFFDVAEGVERGVAPAQAGHRVEVHEFEVVLAAAADFREDLVETEFLMEKRRPEVE